MQSAIPYGQLKKVLKRVARELNDIGLDPETLRQLRSLDPDSTSPLAVKYGLKGTSPWARFAVRVCVLSSEQFAKCILQLPMAQAY